MKKFTEEYFNNAIEEIMKIDSTDEQLEYYELNNEELENIIKMCKRMHENGYTPPFWLLIDNHS